MSITTLFQRNTQCFNCTLFFHEAIFLCCIDDGPSTVRRFVSSSTASAFSMAWNRPHRWNSTKRGEWAVCRRDDDEASDICNYKWRDAMHEWLPIFFSRCCCCCGDDVSKGGWGSELVIIWIWFFLFVLDAAAREGRLMMMTVWWERFLNSVENPLHRPWKLRCWCVSGVRREWELRAKWRMTWFHVDFLARLNWIFCLLSSSCPTEIAHIRISDGCVCKS